MRLAASIITAGLPVPAALILGLGLALVSLSCSVARPVDPADPQEAEVAPVQWELSPRARADYAFLAYQDALRGNRMQEAEASLTEVAALAPEPQVFQELAELRIRLGRLLEARQALKDGLAAFPGDKWLTLRLADFYRLEKRYDDAAATLQGYIALAADDDAQHQLARIRLEQRSFPEALRLLDALPPESVTAQTLTLRAKAHQGMGAQRKAENSLHSALVLDSGYLPALVELAELYEAQGRLRRAEETYTRIMETGETGPEVWLRLVALSLRQKDPTKAMTLVELGPRSVAFQLEAARQFIEARYHAQARDVLVPLAADPEPEPTVLFYLALLAYEGDNDPEAALAILERIPEDSPHYVRALGFRANLLAGLKRHEAALGVLTEGRRRAPMDTELAELQALVHQEMDDPDAAAAVLEEALARTPDQPRLVFRLALARYDQGRAEESLALAEQFLAAEPDSPEALNLVGYILADQGRDLDRALALIRRAMELTPDNAYIIDSLAWAHFRRGELAAAWREIRRAVDLQDKDPSLWEHYADIAAATGRKAEARRGYAKALEYGHRQPERIESKLRNL